MNKQWVKQFVVASLGFMGLMSVMMVTQLQKHNDLLDQGLIQNDEVKHHDYQVAEVKAEIPNLK